MKLKQIFKFLLFAFSIGFFFSACNNDEADDKGPKSRIVSEWEITDPKLDVVVTDASLKDSVANFLKNITWAWVGSYTLREDGTYTKRLTPECGTGMKYPEDYFTDGVYVFKGDSLYLDDNKTAFLYMQDGFFCSKGPSWGKKMIAEHLRIDETKIIKAEIVFLYQPIIRCY